MSTRQITIQEMFNLMDQQFQGRQIEIDLSPIRSANTYHWFSFKEVRDAIEFVDLDNNHPQMLSIFKDDILDIIFSEGKTLFENVFTLNMKSDSQIQICVYELPVYCCKCFKVLNLDKMNTVWEVNSSGGYGSHFDGEGNICIKVCDDCMYEFVYGQKYVDLDDLDSFDNGLEKEKTCH